MAYAEDLKSSGAKAPCGFDPRPRQLKINGFLRTRRSKRDYSMRLTATFDSHGLRDSEVLAYKTLVILRSGEHLARGLSRSAR